MNYFATPEATQLLKTESRIESQFLGDNLLEICEAAADTREALFISTAGLPLGERQKAFVVWRANQVATLLRKSQGAGDFLKKAEPALAGNILAGNVRLADLHEMVMQSWVDDQNRRAAERTAAKKGVWNVVRDKTQDAPAGCEKKKIPRYVMFTEAGDVLFFRRFPNAFEFAQALGCSSLLIEIKSTQTRLLNPRFRDAEELDSEDADADGDEFEDEDKGS